MQSTSVETGREVLSFIPAATPRAEWARVAMGIKSEWPGVEGFELFDTWSRTAPDHYDEKAARATWRSVRAGGGVTFASVVQMAQRSGYTGSGPASTLTPAELEMQRFARAERERVERRKRDAEHAEAAERANELWASASESEAEAHSYPKRKGVQAHGSRVAADGTLLVPVRDAEGELWNVQRIAAAKPASGGTDKLFLKGGRKAGLWCLLGTLNRADAVLLAEGFATGASLLEATGRPVAVAFDAGNLKSVATSLRQALPSTLIVVCGDNDRAAQLDARRKNTGAESARAAATLVHGVAVLPQGLPAGQTDWNDMHQLRGLEAVRAPIEAAIKQAMAARLAAGDAAPTSAPAAIAAKTAPQANAQDERFAFMGSGLYYCGRDRDGNPAQPQWLCSRLEVEALTRDTDGNNWGLLLHFSDPDGQLREWAMPLRMLSGDGAKYRTVLQGMGLRINTASAARARLTEYLQGRDPKARAVCTECTGWHSTPEGAAAYVLPDETIGATCERIVFQANGQTERNFRQRGDVAAWRERVGALCVGNSRLVFVVASAFAAPLLEPSGVDSGGFHLRGDSSSGKTTALKVAASVNGAPSYVKTWRATDNAVEVVASQHCDALLIQDELGQVESRVAGEIAYMLANGTGKGRSTRNSALRPRLSWRVLLLSSGELSLAAHMAEAARRVRAGQEVRMVDLPADAGSGMGLFQSLHGREGAAALANDLTRASAACYGAPGIAWLHHLVGRWDGLAADVRRRVDAVRLEWVPAGSSGQVERVATRMALVAVAGEMATEAGLTGWPVGESERAARECFEAWLVQRGGTGNAEVRQMLRQVRHFIELHGEGRFTWWHRAADDHATKTINRAGFRRLLNADGEPIKSNSQHMVEYGDRMPAALGDEVQVDYFVLPELFRAEVCAGFDAQAVARTLIEHGVMKAEPGRTTVKTRLPGLAPSRCYHILPSIMELDL